MAINLSSRHWMLVVLGVALAAYILFQARFLILGPRVWIDIPADGAVLSEPVATVSGRAENVAWITLNGTQIYTDQQGLWSEKLPLAEGPSIMTVRVRDRFGREREKSVTIILRK
ncbi:hypothetical protein KW784_01915 [Candidatus Parcubacteria bacterium]|nr:hypothetical protein [Candidatus Parcubacteria bacterium]